MFLDNPPSQLPVTVRPSTETGYFVHIPLKGPAKFFLGLSSVWAVTKSSQFAPRTMAIEERGIRGGLPQAILHDGLRIILYS